MGKYYKFFYIFAIILFIILSIKEYITYLDKENIKNRVLNMQAKNLIAFVNSFREVYQKTFIKYHIKLDKNIVHLVPVAQIPLISKEFSKKIGGQIEIKLLSDRPRNPKNIVNNEELKIIKQFEQHKSNELFQYKEDGFVYYKPLYIKQTCLKCHNSKLESPKFIRDNYNNAYGYKLGDVRGMIKIKIKNSEFVNVLTPKFYKKLLLDFILYCLVLIIVWFLIRKIEKQEELHTQRLLEINKQLRKEKRNAELNAKTKSEFLANMSHEIRTPLNAMFGFITLLNEKELDKESKEYLTIIRKSGDMLLSVINDILDFSKIESGKLSVEKISFSPKEEIRLIYNLFEAKANEKGVNLYIRENNLDIDIISDPLRLKQVISNLLSNAIKFTPSGKNIHLNVDYDDNKEILYIEIRDEGIGISDTKLISIFNPFSQADNSTTRKYGGTGLGLSISFKLVQLLGGELQVKTKINKGSTFYFSIPAKKGVKTNQDVLKSKRVDFNYTILIVEDNKANQMFLSVVLKKLGVKFDIANDGIEGIEKYKQNYLKYDLILMDENMPNMSGSEATKEIRSYEKLHKIQNIFIVALTANALSGDKERFLAVGMNEYISKPIDIEKLKHIFRRYDEYINNRSK